MWGLVYLILSVCTGITTCSTWVQISPKVPFLFPGSAAATHNGVIFAGQNYVYYTRDFKSYTNSSVPATMVLPGPSNGFLSPAEGTSYWFSKDGKTWTNHTAPILIGAMVSLVPSIDAVLFLQGNPAKPPSSGKQCYVTMDGLTWKSCGILHDSVFRLEYTGTTVVGVSIPEHDVWELTWNATAGKEVSWHWEYKGNAPFTKTAYKVTRAYTHVHKKPLQGLPLMTPNKNNEVMGNVGEYSNTGVYLFLIRTGSAFLDLYVKAANLSSIIPAERVLINYCCAFGDSVGSYTSLVGIHCLPTNGLCFASSQDGNVFYSYTPHNLTSWERIEFGHPLSAQAVSYGTEVIFLLGNGGAVLRSTFQQFPQFEILPNNQAAGNEPLAIYNINNQLLLPSLGLPGGIYSSPVQDTAVFQVQQGTIGQLTSSITVTQQQQYIRTNYSHVILYIGNNSSQVFPFPKKSHIPSSGVTSAAFNKRTGQVLVMWSNTTTFPPFTTQIELWYLNLTQGTWTLTFNLTVITHTPPNAITSHIAVYTVDHTFFALLVPTTGIWTSQGRGSSIEWKQVHFKEFLPYSAGNSTHVLFLDKAPFNVYMVKQASVEAVVPATSLPSLLQRSSKFLMAAGPWWSIMSVPNTLFFTQDFRSFLHIPVPRNELGTFVMDLTTSPTFALLDKQTVILCLGGWASPGSIYRIPLPV